MEKDKWVWGDEEDLTPQPVPLLDEKLTPIVEWPDVKPEPPGPRDPPEIIPVEATPPAPVALNGVAPPSADAEPPEPVAAPKPVVAEARPVEAPASAPRQGAASPDPPRRKIPPSLVKAIVLHLEGKIEDAFKEIQEGLRNGEPPAELYAALGALQMESERYEDAVVSYREVLKREPENETCAINLELCEERLKELKKPPKPPASLVKAIVLHMEKKIEEAIKELQGAIKTGEQPVDVYAALGHLQFETGRFDAAAEAYAQVLKREPLHKTCHYNLAVCLEKLGRHKESLGSFQKAFELNSQRVEMGIGIGVSLLHLRRFAEALIAFEDCLKTHPDDTAALFGKAFALQSSARQADAQAAYQEVLKRDPKLEEALVNLIAMSVEQANDSGVREYCGKLLAIRPDSKIALEALMAADLAAAKYEAACSTGERLTRLAPDSFEAWFNYGVACHGAQRSDEAIAAFSKASRIRPKSVEASSNLGKACHAKGDLEAAKAAYESALKLSPDNPAVLWNLVLVAEQSGAPRDAEKFCALLAAKAPKSDAVAFRLGCLRFDRGDFKGSADAYRSCLKTKPDWPAAQLNLGLALWKSGNREEARQKLEAISTAPYITEALHYLALIAVEREDYNAALGYYKSLADGGERSPELFYNTGLIMQNLGLLEDAANQYRAALAVKPDLAEATQALAQVSKIAGRSDDARKNPRKGPTPVAQMLKAR
jgi:tetratricopeptide (TPR) repeat protein